MHQLRVLREELRVFMRAVALEDPFPCCRGEREAASGVEHQGFDPRRERLGVVRRHQQAGPLVADAFAQPAGIGGDHREPGGHRLEGHQAAGLGVRRQHAQVAARVQGRERGARQEPELADKRQLGEDPRCERAVARDDERGALPEARARQLPCRDKSLQVFLRGEPSDVQDDRAVVAPRHPAAPSRLAP
jgi:hypothetical protein